MNLSKQAQIFSIRRMRDVPRLAGFYKTRPYSDAEHCYYTGMLFEDIADADRVKITRQEISWVYRHDALEVLTGDLLYPAKNHNKTTKACWEAIEREIVLDNPHLAMFADKDAETWFSEDAWALFKDCDSLELYMFCKEEEKRGNKIANPDGSKVADVMLDVLKSTRFPSVSLLIFMAGLA